MRSAALIVGAMLVVFTIVAFALRETIVDEIFSGQDVLFWGLVGGFASFSAEFYARGYLAGMGRFDLYAGLLVAESLVLVGAAALAAAGVFDGVAPFAIGIALAPLLGLAGVGAFLAPRRRRGRRGARPRRDRARRSPPTAASRPPSCS